MAPSFVLEGASLTFKRTTIKNADYFGVSTKFSLKYANIEVEIPAELKAEEGIEMAINAYRKSLADRKVQNMIHLREKAEMMTAAEIHVTREEGRAEGLAEGEKKNCIEVAGKLLQDGMDRERVKAITGLTDEEFPIV